jgi:cold shock CspA family protein
VTNDVINLVKLHGCITRTKDHDLPLILTVDQYNEYEHNRTSLFNYLYELAIEYSIIFVGHSLQDANIRNIISLVQKNAPQGQRHYLLKPGAKEAEVNLWSSKKIGVLDYKFECFMNELDSEIELGQRFAYLTTPSSHHKIQTIFNTHLLPSDELIRFLTNDVEYVKGELSFDAHVASEFYKGSDLGWYPLVEKLAIKRSLYDRFFEEVILRPESDRSFKTELILLKGEAGAGKTVFLKQVAWQLKDLEFGCALRVKRSDKVSIELIKEIFDKSSERIFIFWDDPSLSAHKISHILQQAEREKIALTVIAAERYNEWNLKCDSLKEYVTETYFLKNLNIIEVEDLIGKLEVHDCLGPNLKNKSRQDKIKAFTVSYERQLLVALHEATMGERFEDIIFNEYESIEPLQAKAIYRTICTLNRLRVPVRAGLIARIFEINFEQFKENFFLPLEKIVLWESSGNDDIHYRARHSEIAEIVFSRTFPNSLDRYNEYISILDKINISYESDRISFRQLMRAKSLHDIFPDFQDVTNIYKYALQIIGEDAYLLQQMANFERIRPNGNLSEAIELLERARGLAPYDSSIYHSLATVWRDKAKATDEPYSRIKYRGEAKKILLEATSKWGGTAYISSTNIELAIDNFIDLLSDDNVSNRIIDESISKIEEDITQSKQRFPEESILATLEARLAGIMKDDVRVLSSLTRAFNDNNRDPYIAIRLSKIHLEKDDKSEALKVLQSAIERRRNNPKLNFHYAEILRSSPDSSFETLAYYYKRSFSPGDKNYQAKFWFARFAYESSDPKDVTLAQSIFEELRGIRGSKEDKLKVRAFMGGDDTPKIVSGFINSIHTGYGFITVDGAGKELFFPRKEIENELWDAVRQGDRVKFNIGYTYNGPICCSIAPN